MKFNDEQIGLINLFRKERKEDLEIELEKALDDSNNDNIKYLIKMTLNDLREITEEEFKKIKLDI